MSIKEEIQTKDTDNSFNNIAAENFTNLDKGKDRTPNRTFRTQQRLKYRKVYRFECLYSLNR
jgi:hypothetical protein